MPQLSRRSSGFTESVIRRMTRVANRCHAINLSQGFPDFDPPKEITDELKNVADLGPHQYEITWGSDLFRRKLAEKQSRLMGLAIDPETQIVVTCGSTEAMMTAMMAVCNPGDKVIVFSPFYENYAADAILSGAEAVYVPLLPPDFRFDREELRKAFAQGAKALVLCNPSNPAGKVFSREELSYIAQLAVEYDAFVITDEVYEHIVYKPFVHTYIASLPGMFGRTLSCSSLSKTYSITGWRLGYVIGPENVISVCRQVHDFLTVGAAAPLQKAAVKGLEFGPEYYEWLADLYEGKRKLFLDGLDAVGLPYFRPQGAYYVLADISKFGAPDDTAFCEWLAEEIGVAAVPGSSFFRENVTNYIRFHFAKKDGTLLQAIEKLQKLNSCRLPDSWGYR